MSVRANAMPANIQLNKGAKRRKRMLLFCVVVFLTWALPAFVAQWSKLNLKTAEMQGLQDQLQQLKLTNEQTKREVERLNDKEYIEQKIRTELHWYKPGETVFPATKAMP
ncbi:septum formation initiator family protein [Paenibacillus chartarius]|uniref:Septum formation initiator family protein n=1 Tax=Paenibacillus chartarius TaxID=747481 RepID=A0ABV6DTY4_9BACL